MAEFGGQGGGIGQEVGVFGVAIANDRKQSVILKLKVVEH